MTDKKKNSLANLIPFNERTEEERKEFNSRGGKKSGETRRQQKKFKELMQAALDGELENGMTTKEGMVATAVMKAVQGDIRALELVMEVVGEKPTQMEHSGTIKIENIEDMENYASMIWEKEKNTKT